MATLKTVESCTISDDPLLVTVVRQSAAGRFAALLMETQAWVLGDDLSKLQARSCGTRHITSVDDPLTMLQAHERPWRSTVLRLQMDCTWSDLDTGRRQVRSWVFAWRSMTTLRHPC